MRECSYSFTFPVFLHQMNYIHATTALLPGKQSLVHIGWGAVWGLVVDHDAVEYKKVTCFSRELNPDFSVVHSVA